MVMDGDNISQLLSAPTNGDITHTQLLPLSQSCDEIDWEGLLCGSSLSLEMEKASGSEGIKMGDFDGGAGRRDEGNNGGKNKGKMMMGKRSSSAVVPRIAFQTRSAEDVLDDGYRWRKYGQKAVKHSTHPRSYYRCTHHTCNVKKQIQRHSKDPTIVVTTYEGIHNHPSEKLMETLSPLLKQLQFLSGI
ncbi:probable WRKY transcription factor 24 [Momordica charantia]|uniref:Probable WRKY transcription factor 24 n=1 Tax=Momordica charantia TaxID=3673 RepID=A0A6J1C449_MOMCH|nr:probable WRKY transcription factor 24 [Momordica charantia]